jgi:hypothetical protein
MVKFTFLCYLPLRYLPHQHLQDLFEHTVCYHLHPINGTVFTYSLVLLHSEKTQIEIGTLTNAAIRDGCIPQENMVDAPEDKQYLFLRWKMFVTFCSSKNICVTTASLGPEYR